MTRLFYCLIVTGIFIGSPTNCYAVEQRLLLGSVTQLCADTPHCFELRVEKRSASSPDEVIRIHYGINTQLYDPENYTLTLTQSPITTGSHLRVLISPLSDSATEAYQASIIWIGD